MSQEILHLTFLVDGSPHEHSLAADSNGHFFRMPYTIGTATPLANVRGNCRTELVSLASDCLIGDIDFPFSEQILDISQAQREAKIEPHCLAD